MFLLKICSGSQNLIIKFQSYIQYLIQTKFQRSGMHPRPPTPLTPHTPPPNEKETTFKKKKPEPY